MHLGIGKSILYIILILSIPFILINFILTEDDQFFSFPVSFDVESIEFDPFKDIISKNNLVTLGLNTDLKKILEGFGLKEGANSEPAHYVVEKAFVG